MRGYIWTSLILIVLVTLHSCIDEVKVNETRIKDDAESFTIAPEDTLATVSTAYYGGYNSEISTLFDQTEFPQAYLEQLLVEIKVCNPQIEEMQADGITPCTPSYFQFYSYNKNRKIEDAFMLQIKKGVNGFPYRRLLIFTRENGLLVKMNGIIGYLVEKRPSLSGMDDLVVAVVDNIGGYYDRYDVLIRYENGKYHFVEAIGDLEGTFNTKELKEEASKQIKQRIKEKELIF